MIAVDAAAPYLFDSGIIPHIVITAEEQAHSALIFKRIKGWFPGVCLVASTTASTLGLYIAHKQGATVYFYNSAHIALAHRYQMKLLPVNYPSLTSLCGSVTGHALALSQWLGVRKIALIGADFQVEDMKKTHAGDYRVDGMPKDAINESFAWHQRELERANSQNVGVVNCTVGGALEVFPRQPLESFLAGCYRMAVPSHEIG